MPLDFMNALLHAQRWFVLGAEEHLAPLQIDQLAILAQLGAFVPLRMPLVAAGYLTRPALAAGLIVIFHIDRDGRGIGTADLFDDLVGL